MFGPLFQRDRLALWAFVAVAIAGLFSLAYYRPGQIAYSRAITASSLGALLILIPAVLAGYAARARTRPPYTLLKRVFYVSAAVGTGLVTLPLANLVFLPRILGLSDLPGAANAVMYTSFGATLIMLGAVATVASLVETALAISDARAGADENPPPANRSDATRPARYKFKTEDRTIFLEEQDIVYLSARGGRTLCRTRTEELLLAGNLKANCAELPGERFLRVHRSHVVNVDLIAGLRYYAAGSYTLYLKDDAWGRLPVGRTHAPSLRERLGLITPASTE